MTSGGAARAAPAAMLALALLGALACRAGDGAVPASEGGTTAQRKAEDRDGFFSETNLKRYVGRTVGELIADAPEPYEEVYPIDEPPGKLLGFALRFPGNRIVDVYCRELAHVPPFSEERRWDFEAFKKEKISQIVVKRP